MNEPTVLHSSRRTWRLDGPHRSTQLLSSTLTIEQNAFGIFMRFGCVPLPARATRPPVPAPARPLRRRL